MMKAVPLLPLLLFAMFAGLLPTGPLRSAPVAGEPDLILLRDGERIRGRVLVIDREQLRIRTAEGQLMVVNTGQVNRIQYAGARHDPGVRRLAPVGTPAPATKAAQIDAAPATAPEAAPDTKAAAADISLLTALWRSLLAPGFGQYSQGRREVGLSWAGSFSFLGGGAGGLGSPGLVLYVANLIDVYLFHAGAQNPPVDRMAAVEP